MKSPGQLVTEGGGIDCLGRRLHKLKIMIIFSLLCHFFSFVFAKITPTLTTFYPQTLQDSF